ncbi:MAG: energy transducer TonB [Candidatus Krumholzibacteria bacterium]|nr:energy transducer TonB [Candidatus Krumholzibacteria bacterium]
MVATSFSFDKLREHYSSCLLYSLLAALFIHFLIFYFTPAFEFKPYVFEFEARVNPIKLADEIKIEDPPPPVKHPPVEIEPAAEGEIISEPEIPANVLYHGDIFRDPIQSSAVTTQNFYGFDEPPALVKFANPFYPELARQAGIEGTVLLSVLVGKEGSVLEVSVLKSDVPSSMEKAAILAARKFKFTPARQNTVPVQARISVPVVFTLK